MRLLALLLVLPFLQDKPAEKPKPVKADQAFKAGTLWTGTGAPIENAVILTYKSRITAVGKASDVKIPDGVKVHDFSDKTLIPGLIDAASHLFLASSEIGVSGSAEQSVLDGIDPFQEDWEEAVAAGVTSVYLYPAYTGSQGAAGAVVRLNGEKGRKFVLKEDAALHFALGVSTSDTSTRVQRYNAWKSLKGIFEGAKKYKEAWEKYTKDLADYKKKKRAWDKEQKAKKPAPPKDPKKPAPKPAAPKPEPKKPGKPAFNERNQSIVRIWDARNPIAVRITAHQADAIEFALDLAKEYKFRLILDQATEGPSVAKKIVEAKVPVITGPIFRYGMTKVDYLSHSVACAAAFQGSGIQYAIASFPDSQAGHWGAGATRFLPDGAACAASKGLTREQALASITSQPAAILGLGRVIGSITPGLKADFVVLTGEPLEPDSRVVRTIIDGKTVYEK